MSNAATTDHDLRPQDSERNEVLNAIASKWDKFSRQEISDLKTNDELVTQVVAKYGINRTVAQRDIDTLMNGRSLKA